jgi:hypothetical protein
MSARIAERPPSDASVGETAVGRTAARGWLFRSAKRFLIWLIFLGSLFAASFFGGLWLARWL